MSKYNRLNSPVSFRGRDAYSPWYTVAWNRGSEWKTPLLDVVLVHGCRNSDRSTKPLEINLVETAKTISEHLEGCRVHVYGYDASRVLHEGEEKFQRKTRQLLTKIKENCTVRVAIISHNSSAWIVQNAIVQILHDQTYAELPVGIVFFGLPHEPVQDQWQKVDWNLFSQDLAKHLNRRKADSRSDVRLDFSTIKATMSKFECRQTPDGQDVQTKLVSCSGPRGIQQGVRAATGSSHGSSSSNGSYEHAGTVLVKIDQRELNDMIEFLGQFSRRRSLSTLSNDFTVRYFLERRRPGILRNSLIEQQRPHDIAHNRQYEGHISSAGKSSTGLATGPPAAQSCETLAMVLPQRAEITLDRNQKRNLTYEALQGRAGQSDLRKGKSHIISDTGGLKERLVEKAHTSPVSGETNLESSRNLAKWYFKRGDLDDADWLYRDLMKRVDYRDVRFSKMKLAVAKITWLRGRYGDSEELFQELSKDVEGFSIEGLTCKTAKWLALSQWKQGKYTEAIRTIRDCIGRMPDKRTENQALLSTHALVLASNGSFSQALKDSTKAMDVETHETNQSGSPKMEKIVCIINHARVLYEIGRYDEAAQKNNEALSDLKKRFGPKHFVTLDADSLRASLLVVKDNTSEIAEEVQRTLRQMRKRLGEDHPSTLETVQTLVLAYKNDGRYSDAEATARYVFNKCLMNRELGESHPQTSRSRTILADVLLAVGKWEEAEGCQRDISINGRITYLHRLTLATILRERGRWDKARALAVELLKEQLLESISDEKKGCGTDHDQMEEFNGELIKRSELKRILSKSQYVRGELHDLLSGWDDPIAGSKAVRVYLSLIQTMQCLALCEQVRDDANLAFADALLGKLQKICSRRFGVSHRSTIDVQHDLAVNHRLSGKFSDALEIITQVVDRRRNLLGVDHPDYLISKHQRSVILLRLFRWQEALKEQEFVSRAQEFLLGTEHPMTVLSRFTLAGIYHSLNRFREAGKLLTQVIEDQRRIFNPKQKGSVDHAVVMRSRARLALVQLDRAIIEGDAALFDDARKEQADVVEYRSRSKHLGHNHHLTQSSRNDLAQIEQASGRRSQAKDIYEELLSELNDRGTGDTHSRSHENILAFQVRSNLATCFFEMGHLEDAEKLQSQLHDEVRARQETDDRYVASAFNLALTCNALGKLPTACELLRDAVKESQRRLGNEHPQTQELEATLEEWSKQYPKPELLDTAEGRILMNTESFGKNIGMVYVSST